MSFENELKKRVVEAEATIKSYLPKEEGFQKTIFSAMNYSVLAGGKRLRPLLMQETYHLFGGKGRAIGPFMTAIELIHTYSLVHDDLPALDNDEYRRGQKTTHVVYGEAMGILTGDALLNYAFEIATLAFEQGGDPVRIGKALSVLAKKAGVFGMIGGQVVDVESEKKGLQISEDKLLFIHAHKTAALIQAALMTGAILAGAGEEDIQKLNQAGYNIGVAFQIQDDILDVTSTLEELGKPIGSDARNEKVTYVSFKGLTQAQEDQKRLSEEAITILQSLFGKDTFLEELVQSLVYRKK